MHYAFDAWMTREFPAVTFERYCDDIIVHARSANQALQLRAMIASRLAECGLQLNEHKTRIVYCKDDDRRGSHEHTSFDFLGYTFRPRLSRSRFGKHFLNFSPAVSGEAKTRMRREMRRWRVACRSDKTLTDLADVQPSAPGLDQLLRTLLQVHVVSGSAPLQRHAREVGDAEIQTTAPPPEPGAQVHR
jgi:RNA-directed DNA polymerase